MSNQVYSNLETRERYHGPKKEFIIQLNNTVSSQAPFDSYSDTILDFTTTPNTNTGNLSWDGTNKYLVCETDGVYSIEASIAFSGNIALPLEVIELYFKVDNDPALAHAITSVPRTNVSVAGEDSAVITTSYTFNAIRGTTIQPVLRSKTAVFYDGVGMGSFIKRTYITCIKIT